MRDNLSIPTQLLQSNLYKSKGAGRPVAQAITWWGSDTGNTLNDVISFTTGLNWEPKSQAEIRNVEGFDQGFFKTVLGRAFGTAAGAIGGAGVLGALGEVASIVISSTDSGRSAITDPKINQALRDKFSTNNGPLSDFIFNPVDTVDSTYFRARGLRFDDTPITLKFHYELASLGEVNTKAAMVDIIGNLLALGTNYGNFLTPDVRYDNGFPAIGFPGGDPGLLKFYSDPLEWTKTAIKYLADPNGTTDGNPQAEEFRRAQTEINQSVQQLESVIKQITSEGGYL
jgi:hypothetical protein